MDIHTKVTPALHPDSLKNLDGYDERYAGWINPAVEAFSIAYQGIAATHKARESAKSNPIWNDAHQIIETDNLATKYMEKAAKAFDTAAARLKSGIESIERELNAPIGSGNTALATEIRNHVKSLPVEERFKLLERAHAEGDETTLNAVLAVPGYLSGISEEMRKIHIRRYHERRNPEDAQRVKLMRGALEAVNNRAGLIFTQFEKAVGMPPHKVKALREAKANAEKAFVVK